MNVSDITSDLFEVFLDADEVADSYKTPGQYCVIKLPDSKPLFLVLSNCIGDKTWSFLVRDANNSSNILHKTEVGSILEVSQAQGNGYPLHKLKGSDVILFSAGTGLASFRSVLDEIVKHRDDYKKVHLLHGSRFENEIPYKKEFENWSAFDIEVSLVLSKPSENWQSFNGHVQDVLEEKNIKLDGFSGLICGPTAMVEDVTRMAKLRGLRPELIYSNY